MLTLGPSDNIAIDQPQVAVALYTLPSPGQLIGPVDYNSFVLDTGATTILAAQEATGELQSGGLQTVATYYENGVAGTSATGVSAQYEFNYAGTDGIPQTLSPVRILAAPDLDLGGFGGIAGMPLLVGHSTTVDLTTQAATSQGSISVSFSPAPPPATAHRYDVPLKLVNFPLDGQVNPTDPLPTSAPLSMAPVQIRNGSHVVESHFVIDTGAQVSIISTAVAKALGIDPATDSVGSLPVGGIGGTVDMPLIDTDSLSVHTLSKTDLKWTGLEIGVLDIDPNVAGVLGMDLLDSGWFSAAFGGGGTGYLSQVQFDFRNAANMTGDMLLDVDPSHDIVNSPNNSAPWDFNGSGNFSDLTKWYSLVLPTGAGTTATFGNGILNTVNAPTITVTVDSAVVVGSLVFNNTQGSGYVLASDGIAGHGITLDNGGAGATVSVAPGVTAVQQIQTSLTMADDTTFDIATGGSLRVSGGIGETGGSHSITLISGGTLIIDGPSTYTGSTTVSNGTLTTTANGMLGGGPLAINAGDSSITSMVNVGSNQTVSALSGTIAGSGIAQLTVAAGTTLTVNQSSNTNFAGTIALSPGPTSGSGGQLAKSGGGTLEVNGIPSFAVNSGINVSGGTLRFNIAAGGGPALVGTGVSATISGQAVLELAGSAPALAYGTNHTKILNNSSAPAGLLVSGTNQVVGGIDGSGNVQVNAGANLTADHIIQSALVIGGAAGNPAVVTIAASDNQGNPLGISTANGLAVSNSLSSSGSLSDGAAGSRPVSRAGDFTAISGGPSSTGSS
ncbi:MAG TPA: aspartyl protease family protein, partial [Pirellulales bacterium]|nr:aspartyl protease family protein [Pirellulales bacterium]